MSTMKLNPEDPILQPPYGVESNFENPPNGNVLMCTIFTLGCALSVILYTVRLYDQISMTKWRPHREEYIALPCILSYIAACVFTYMIASSTGFFVRGWNMQVKDLIDHRFNLFVATILYNFSMPFLKSAILVQWTRIFSPNKRHIFYWMCYVVAALNALFYIVTIILQLVQCRPLKYYWDKTIDGHCINIVMLSPVSGIINLIFDVIIMALPQKAIWTLNMSLKKKAGVSVVFFVGILTCVLAAVRLSFAVGYMSTGDYSYEPSYQLLLGSLEVFCGLLTFILPGVPHAFFTLYQNGKSSFGRVLRFSKGAWKWSTPTLTGSRRKSSTGDPYAMDDGTDERSLVPLEERVTTRSSFHGKIEAQYGYQAPPPVKGLPRTPKSHNLENNVSDTETDVYSQHETWTQRQ